jgi:tagatose 1,6-diphosphate aldolase
MKLSEGKLRRLKALSDSKGVIAAAAMDQRGSLKKAIAKAKGVAENAVTADEMSEFKVAVSKVLTPHASAILLDPEFGLEAAKARSKNAGLLLAYEESGYDNTKPGRLPDLLPHVSVKRIGDMGGDAVKILLYYNPFDDKAINSRKHAFLERVGAECAALDVPFFLEPLAYDDEMDEKSLEFAKKKPDYVRAYMDQLSDPRFGVDVLKVEVPINMAFVKGSAANKSGDVAYDRDQALRYFRDAADAAQLPFIYLSAGVDDDVFRESLMLAGESGARFSGVLCGRATWKDGIPTYAKQGRAAFETWLNDRGVKNINMLNEVLDESAVPWWTVYGEKPTAS